jgi:hypothetical protein
VRVTSVDQVELISRDTRLTVWVANGDLRPGRQIQLKGIPQVWWTVLVACSYVMQGSVKTWTVDGIK